MTSADTIPALFFERARALGDRPFLWRKAASGWHATPWSEAERIVRVLAKALTGFGIVAGDRVALIAENQPNWVLADLAIMAAGAITVPAYTTYTTEDFRHVLSDSGAVALILGSNVLARRVVPAADQLLELKTIISFERLTGQTAADTYLWDDLLAVESAGHEDLPGGDANDTACLIYTSGTGGVPKGVMLTHRNMISNATAAKTVLEMSFHLENEIFLSFLPLTHSYEHTAGLVLPLYLGAQTYFTTPEALASDMPVVRPTIMTAVPRLFETLQKRILQATERVGGWRLGLFRLALRVGRQRLEAPRSMTVLDRLLDALVDPLVRRAIRRRFGGRLKVLVSGGAPLNPEIALFFLALGVTLIQGYGQTESGPVVGVNPPNRIKPRTVGPPFDGVAVRIAADGEILVRGDNVMKGYWRDPEATARVIRDGWLHTGDIGRLDEDGYLVISDRKRDFIKTSGGDMVSPQRIEGLLTVQPGIAQAFVHGDQRPYIVAVLVLDPDATDTAASGAIKAVNQALPAAERIRRHAVIAEPFSVANGHMTPTLKIRRHTIREAYAGLLESLYERG